MNIATTNRLKTGVPGLDRILKGGFLQGRCYMVCGAPGTGKTIFGMQFLRAEPKTSALFVSFTEPETHLRRDAETLGIPSDGITFLDLTPDADVFSEEQSYDIFSPVEVEREPITRTIRAQIEESDAKRIFIDGFSELRMLASDLFHFRRMSQSFFRFVSDRGATVLVGSTEARGDVHQTLQSLTDGVMRLAGRGDQRSFEVIKMRGSDFISGLHAVEITSAGLEILPGGTHRSNPSTHRTA